MINSGWSHLEAFAREPLFYEASIPVFTKPNEYTENYEQISKDHLASVERDGTNPFILEELWVQFENSTIELIKKYSKPRDRILDVGVGLGRILEKCPELEKYGMDISFSYLKIAQNKKINVCYSLVEDMPYRKEFFDIIVCTDMLEHVFDLNLCIAKMLSVLKRKGILIVRVPYREDLGSYLGPMNPYRYVHMRSFDEYFLQLLFDRIFGCKILETTMSGVIQNDDRCKWPGVVKRRMLMRLVYLLRRVSIGIHNSCLRRLYHPLEINMAVMKEVNE